MSAAGRPGRAARPGRPRRPDAAGSRAHGGPALTALGVAYVLGAAALACVLVWPVYGTWRVALVTGVGTGVGLGVALAARGRRWSGWTTAAVGAAAYLVVAVPVAVPYRAGSAPDWLRGELEALAGAVLGWKQVLTLQLPVQEYRATLVPWLLVVLVAALLAGLVAPRGDGRAALAMPAMGALALVAAALGPVEPGRSVRLGPLEVADVRVTAPLVGFVALSLVWSGVRVRTVRARAIALATATAGGPRRRHHTVLGSLGLVSVGAAVAFVALGAGLLVAPLADAADRRSARERVAPVLAIQRAASPLDAYRAAFAGEAATAELLRVEVDGAPVDRLRFAVLDDYDGQHFTTSADAPGRQFLRVPRSSADADSTVRVEIGPGYSGIWLPQPAGTLTAPRFAGPRADRLAATYYASRWVGAAVVTAGGTAGGPGVAAGDRYTLLVASPEPGVLDEPGEPLLDGEDHPELVTWVKKQAQPHDAGGFLELVQRLRARGYLSHWLTAADATAWRAGPRAVPGLTVQPAYAGHSTARVEDLFRRLNEQQAAVGDDAGDAALVAAVGDDEQFATAVALLARYLGFESRVVLGVRLGAQDDPSLAACRDSCTGSDLAAWVEVRSPAGAWVTLDADPQVSTPPRPVTQGQELPREPTQVQQPDPSVVEPQDATQDTSSVRQEEEPPPPAEEAAWWWRALRVAAIALAVAAVVLLPVLTVPAAKAARRRARRRVAVPEVATVGAWAELEDRCLDLGAPLTGPTRREAAAATGRPGALALAKLVDEAVYAPVPPGHEVSAQAWRLVVADLAEVGRAHSPWARLVASLRPRSLVRALSAPEPSGPDRPSPKELS